jgi:hypothetical protein
MLAGETPALPAHHRIRIATCALLSACQATSGKKGHSVKYVPQSAQSEALEFIHLHMQRLRRCLPGCPEKWGKQMRFGCWGWLFC